MEQVGKRIVRPERKTLVWASYIHAMLNKLNLSIYPTVLKNDCIWNHWGILILKMTMADPNLKDPYLIVLGRDLDINIFQEASRSDV